MQECVDPQEAVSVLHVALFYSCPRLVHLCELRLAQLLRAGSGAAAADKRAARRNGKAPAAAADGAELDEECELVWAVVGWERLVYAACDTNGGCCTQPTPQSPSRTSLIIHPTRRRPGGRGCRPAGHCRRQWAGAPAGRGPGLDCAPLRGSGTHW